MRLQHQQDHAGVLGAGAALASMFAHCLATLAQDPPASKSERWREGQKFFKGIYTRVGAVYTFAGPSAGDQKYREFMAKSYPQKAFRIVHAGTAPPS